MSDHTESKIDVLTQKVDDLAEKFDRVIIGDGLGNDGVLARQKSNCKRLGACEKEIESIKEKEKYQKRLQAEIGFLGAIVGGLIKSAFDYLGRDDD